MARYRTFKPELFADEKLTECSVDARFLFLGLLPFLDDMGRRQYHPRRIKAEVFPADDEYTVGVVEGLVQELAQVGVIELYDVGKNHYLRVRHFLRHQVVNRPGHCYVPPSPTEGPQAVRCLCPECKARSSKNHGDSRHNAMFLQELTEHSLNDHGAITEHSLPEGKGREGKGVKYNTNTNTNTHTANGDQPNSPPSASQPNPQTNSENRRAARAALDEIVIRMIRLLKLSASPLMLETLTRTIQVKARNRNSSLEWAAQHVLARAALIAQESPPDDWLQWFEDARYEYVPAGDSKLKDRRIEARPTCGGTRCSEGWEMVKVGDAVISKRCADCERAWRDQGE